jgi:AcrR family transcriptional regulator
LLDKALDIFLEIGFERTSIDAITAAAGVAKRTVYQRYEDKTALFKAPLERAITEWIVLIDHLRAAETSDMEKTLLRVGQILLNNLMGPPDTALSRLPNNSLPETAIAPSTVVAPMSSGVPQSSSAIRSMSNLKASI